MFVTFGEFGSFVQEVPRRRTLRRLMLKNCNPHARTTDPPLPDPGCHQCRAGCHATTSRVKRKGCHCHQRTAGCHQRQGCHCHQCKAIRFRSAESAASELRDHFFFALYPYAHFKRAPELLYFCTSSRSRVILNEDDHSLPTRCSCP